MAEKIAVDQLFENKKPFDEIPLYQRTRLFGIKTYQLTSGVKFKSDPELIESMKRAVHDLFGYLASGYDSRDRIMFRGSLLSARDRISYIKGLIILAFDLGYITEIELEDGRKRCTDLNSLYLEAISKFSL